MTLTLLLVVAAVVAAAMIVLGVALCRAADEGDEDGEAP